MAPVTDTNIYNPIRENGSIFPSNLSITLDIIPLAFEVPIVDLIDIGRDRGPGKAILTLLTDGFSPSATSFQASRRTRGPSPEGVLAP